jgi:transposase InsO family protein
VTSRLRFISTHRGVYGVKRLCRILAVSRSGFYQWLATTPARAARTAQEAQLVGVIREVHAQTGGAYGAPRVSVELRERGNPVNHKRIERLMRRHATVGAHLRRRKRTTIPDPATPPAPDLIARDFTAEHINTRWCGDITYLPVAGRWLYLATVIDIASRRLIGWSIAPHMRTSLVIDALTAAIAARGGQVSGVVFHSDRGAQYGASDFARACDAHGIRRSMGHIGSSYDNALAESFFAILKRELPAARTGWDSESQARQQLFRWIAFYNHRRRHSAIGYLSPTDYETRTRSTTVNDQAA